jgi:hypothetical protein
MSERRKYDTEFREGAVTIVRETGKPIAEVARDLASALAPWGPTAVPFHHRTVHERLVALCLLHPQDHGAIEDITLHPHLGELALQAAHIGGVDPGVVRTIAAGHPVLVHPVPRRSGPIEAGGSLTFGARGMVESGPDNAGTWPAPSDGSGPASKTERVREEPATERSSRDPPART